MKAEDFKLVVREKYGKVAGKSNLLNQSSCCVDSTCCTDSDYSCFNDDYSNLEGYNPEADLNLGCGLPTEFAGINKGDQVLDLGSGAGNDCFVARTLVGETGKVTGLDFTEEMIEKANSNLVKTGFKNIEFVKGDIEDMPSPDNTYDVVISNCVLNLVPDKLRAFTEIARVLKKGGHFCISDVVVSGELPVGLKDAAEMYAGCVSGALQKDEYLAIVKNCGYKNILVQKEKRIVLPDSILLNYLSQEELHNFKKSEVGIYSITVTAAI